MWTNARVSPVGTEPYRIDISSLRDFAAYQNLVFYQYIVPMGLWQHTILGIHYSVPQKLSENLYNLWSQIIIMANSFIEQVIIISEPDFLTRRRRVRKDISAP